MKIVKFELTYYDDDDNRDLDERLMDAALDIVCPHYEGEEDHECRMVFGSIRRMTEEQYDAEFERMYPEID